MFTNQIMYTLMSEQQYCSLPDDCLSPDILFIGSAIGLASADYLRQEAKNVLGHVPRIVIAEAGPFELWSHVGDVPGVRRLAYIKNPGRVGEISRFGGCQRRDRAITGSRITPIRSST